MGEIKMKKSVLSFVLVGLAAPLLAGELVVDPYRAVERTWPKHEMKGKDFWMFLAPRWRSLTGVAEERFVQESGLTVNVGLTPRFYHFVRTLSVRDIRAFDTKGQTVPVTATLTCDEKGAVCWTADDGSLVVSCELLDPAVKFLPAVGTFSVRAERPFVRLTFAHGTGNGSEVDAIVNADVPSVTEIGRDTAAVLLKSPSASLTCELRSRPWHVSYTTILDEEKLEPLLRKYPFYLGSFLSYWPILNAPEGTVDHSGLRRIARKYADTFAGITSYEWDSNYLQQLTHGPTGDLLADIRYGAKIPCTRSEMADNMYADWRNVERASGAGHVFGMSGCINFMQYAADFGAKVVEYEITEGIGGQTRIQNMINFSAARQFGIPSSLYMAYFANQHTADSYYSIDPVKKAMGTRGTDWGTSPNYSLRCFYLGYFMGNNFLRFESQTSGQTIEVEKGRWELTGNGKAIKDIWEWSERKDARGDWYAPILLLKDRASISDGKYPLWQRPFAFYELFPATAGDAYVDMVDQIVSPYENRRGFDDPSGGTDLVNSEFADIFTSYIANPLRHGEVQYEDIADYPVIFVLGDMNWTESLANTMKKYVSGGGTLVLTVAQADPFDAGFTGYKVSDGTVDSKDGLVIRNGAAVNPREVIRTTSDGHPLVIRHDYLKGRVLTVTSPNFARTGRDFGRPPKELKELLLAVQKEVVPFSVSGDCETVYNRMPDGSWKVLIVNNNGLAKKTNETEEHYFPEYARDITLDLPEGATAKEVRCGAKVKVEGEGEQRTATLSLPPAGILVVDVKGVKLPKAKGADPKPRPDPVRNFVRRSEPTGIRNDGFRFDPEMRQPKEKAPAVIGEWLARNEFKDTSGNGRDLKVVGPVAFKDGVATLAGDKPTFARIDHAGFKQTIYEGTVETWVKLDMSAKPIRGDKRGATFGVFAFGSNLMLAAQGGRWALSAIRPFSREDIYGPAVTGEWTHLCVAFKDGVYDLYVNGIKAKDLNGPLRAGRQGKDTFYDTLTVWYGSLEPAWGYFFRGDMMGLRYLSRRLSDEEIRKRAEKRW